MIGLHSLGKMRFKVKRTQNVFLTFDDGPHPEITPWVLDQLKNFNQKGTFFLVGKNAYQYPELVSRIRNEGHSIGNHTQNHLNGWFTDSKLYLNDIEKAEEHIDSDLFRPPYGKIKPRQLRKIISKYHVVFWDVLTRDYDQKSSAQNSLEKAIGNTRPGSIIVFHDSEKASKKLNYMLPKFLEFLEKQKIKSSALNGSYFVTN